MLACMQHVLIELDYLTMQAVIFTLNSGADYLPADPLNIAGAVYSYKTMKINAGHSMSILDYGIGMAEGILVGPYKKVVKCFMVDTPPCGE